MKVTGQCHCGAITYEAEVEPGMVNVCHCRDCQRLTGSAFRVTIPAPAAQFRLLSGTPRHYLKVADSGARRVHAFCERCGTPVYACAPQNPQVYSLRVGALNEREVLGPPVREIWIRRRLSWIAKVHDATQVDGQP